MDGVSNSQGCRARLILASPEKDVTEYALRFDFNTSNNEAEHEAVIAGLGIAKRLAIKDLGVFTDS